MNFGIGQQLFAAAILKKKIGTYQRGCRGNRARMCQFLYIFAPFVPFFNTVSEEPRWYVILSIAVVQPRLYIQHFLSRLNQSRLYNRACRPYTTAIKCLFSTSEGRWRASLLEFVILWARSQVAIHHLAYLIDLSGARFFLIPSIDSYLVG